MSEYMGYYCRTCAVASEHWHNHGDAMLSEFYHAKRCLMGSIWVVLGTLARWPDTMMHTFLEEHDGHDIALQSEYGDVRDIIPVEPRTP